MLAQPLSIDRTAGHAIAAVEGQFPGMIALALLLAATDPQAHVIEGATIAAYDPEPAAGSGVLMVLRGVRVRRQSGEMLDLHFIHAGDGRYLGDRRGTPYPAVGATCDFVVETQPASAVAGGAGDHSIIVEARC